MRSSRFYPPSPALLLPVMISLALGGCASKEFVQQEVGTVNARIDELSSRLVNATQRIDGNAMVIFRSEKRISAAEQTATELGSRIDATQTGLADTSQRLEAVAADLKAAGQRIETNTSEIARAHQRIDAVDAGLVSTQKRMEGTESRLGSLEGSLTALRQAGGEAPVAAPVSEAALVAASAPSAATLTQPVVLTDSNRRLDEIAAQIMAASQRIDANTSALDAASERVGKVEASLADTAKRVEGSEAGLADANKRLGEIQGQLAASHQSIATNTAAIAGASQRIDGVEAETKAAGAKAAANEQAITASTTRIEQLETGIKDQGERLTRNETEDAQISATARDALERATAAGKLAEGKLVYETVFSEARTGYAAYQTQLSDADKQALKQFADKLIAENQGVYLEVQGYTDNSGPAAQNLKLSRQRAENVRSFLHEAGIPMHRMTVMAYGETRPVADNASKEGRSQNRRVVVVVLK